MPDTTTLIEILRSLDDLDQDATIFMRRPWSATAACVVAPLTPRSTVPEAVKAAGYEYFLEVAIVHEVLDVFGNWPDKPPTEDEKVRTVLYYGENDAWPEWLEDR